MPSLRPCFTFQLKVIQVHHEFNNTACKNALLQVLGTYHWGCWVYSYTWAVGYWYVCVLPDASLCWNRFWTNRSCPSWGVGWTCSSQSEPASFLWCIQHKLVPSSDKAQTSSSDLVREWKHSFPGHAPLQLWINLQYVKHILLMMKRWRCARVCARRLLVMEPTRYCYYGSSLHGKE